MKIAVFEHKKRVSLKTNSFFISDSEAIRTLDPRLRSWGEKMSSIHWKSLCYILLEIYSVENLSQHVDSQGLICNLSLALSNFAKIA